MSNSVQISLCPPSLLRGRTCPRALCLSYRTPREGLELGRGICSTFLSRRKRSREAFLVDAGAPPFLRTQRMKVPLEEDGLHHFSRANLVPKILGLLPLLLTGPCWAAPRSAPVPDRNGKTSETVSRGIAKVCGAASLYKFPHLRLARWVGTSPGWLRCEPQEHRDRRQHLLFLVTVSRINTFRTFYVCRE